MHLEELHNHIPDILSYTPLRNSAVLVPLVRREDGIHVLFQVRSAKLNRQPGDVCFPGGGRQGEETSEENAIRETCEELLVRPEQIRMLGALDWLAMPRMTVRPFVGELVDYDGSFSADEVEEVFTVPLDFFRNQAPKVYPLNFHLELPEDFPYDKIYGGRDYQWSPRKEEVLFWEYEDHVIWGMSAKILWNLLQFL